MPFTLAHPAAIIPLVKVFKNKVSLTGLIIGSIVPDVEYLINIVERSVISHKAEGFLLFNLPAAIILSLCWHVFVKQIIVWQLPRALSKFFLPYVNYNWFSYLKKNWPLYLISLLIGIALHLIWDSFSHANGYFVVNYKFWHNTFLFQWLSLYRLSWWVSTIIGLYFVLKFFSEFKSAIETIEDKEFNSPQNTNKNFWPLVYLLICSVLFWEWLPFVKPIEFRYLFVAFAGATLFSIIVVSLLFRLEHYLKND